MSRWDAQGYDASFSFVTSYGAPLLDLLAATAGERVLDVGCGTGHQAAELAAGGVEVVGIDADAAMLQTARAAHPGIAFLQVDAQDVDAVRQLVRDTGGPFDAVLSNAALHWMRRQDDVVRGLAESLKPGGRLVVEMGGAGNCARVTAALRAARRDAGLDPDVATSWTFASPDEQGERLRRHGFDVETMVLVERPTPLQPGSTAADWARMFGAALVDDVPDALRLAFDHALDSHAADTGLDRLDGSAGWWIDYVRLRFTATLPGGPGPLGD
jgi:SAM-dependent methyltransferase